MQPNVFIVFHYDCNIHVHVLLIQNPHWEESFKFEIGPDDHYLNVCVWSRLQHGAADLLIGHVSYFLIKIATLWTTLILVVKIFSIN